MVKPALAIRWLRTVVDVTRARNHWGWGWADEALSSEQVREAAGGLAQHLGFGDAEPERPTLLEAIELRTPRLPPPPAALAEICTDAREERVRHAYGRAYRDVVRAFRGADRPRARHRRAPA
jgi:alkyldihydroxyacetonephosphate synthase